MTRIGLVMMILALAIVPASASEMYTFDYPGPDLNAASGNMQPFSFSFTTPSVLFAGDPYSFSPFAVSDTVNTFTFTQGTSTGLSTQGHCFLFATPGYGTLVNGANTQCGLGNPPVNEAAMWFFNGGGNLPSANGVYTNYYVIIFATDAGGIETSSGAFNGTVTISGVPEPSMALLAGLGLLGAGFYSRRRLAGR